MAKRKTENYEEITEDVKDEKIIKITKNGLSVFRKESELEKYINDGWKVSE